VGFGLAHAYGHVSSHTFGLREVLTVAGVIAAFIQAGAAIAIVRLTTKLAALTEGYAKAADASAKAASDSVALARESIDRDWKPDVKIAGLFLQGAGTLNVKIANLSRHSALVTAISIAAANSDEPLRLSRGDLVPGGTIQDIQIDRELNQYRQRRHPAPPFPERAWLQLELRFSLECESGGSRLQTAWLSCRVTFDELRVTNIELLSYSDEGEAASPEIS
jgi:hypothetical protein